jgi:SEC-C motif
MTGATPIRDIAPLPSYAEEYLAGLDPAALIELMTGDEDRVPRSVIDVCARRGEKMAAALKDLVERPWLRPESTGAWWLKLHAVMILGLIPSEQAGLLLARFMRRLSEAEDFDLQDWLAGYWPAFFANKPDTVLPALRDLIADRALDWYIRTNAVDAVVAPAARRGREALDEALAWVATHIVADETEDWDMRLACGNTLLDFPRPRYQALLQDLAARQSVFGVRFDVDDVAHAYAHPVDDPEWSQFDDPWLFYQPGTIAARQADWAREEAGLDEDDTFGYPTGTYIHPAPKVGRNDPCPCGSGKKYKKCCLDREAGAG